MTNQNLVVPDVKSRLNTIIEVAVSISNSPMLPSTAVPESLVMLGGIFGKKIMKRLDDGGGKGGAKVNAWIDSMRASSPTRVKFSLPASQNQHLSSWALHHPSAINMFDQIINKSKHKQIVIFLDYDGTLSPIVADPDKAFMTKKMRATVKDIAKHFPTAIVSGRRRDKVYKFVRLSELYYAGSHGMDIKGPAKSQGSEKVR